jgi:hypothetical protein
MTKTDEQYAAIVWHVLRKLPTGASLGWLQSLARAAADCQDDRVVIQRSPTPPQAAAKTNFHPKRPPLR